MRRKLSGFTLVEIILTIAIIAIIIGITIPTIRNFYRTYKFNDYSVRLESLLNQAKINAIEQSSYMHICLEKGGTFITGGYCSGSGCMISIYNTGTCGLSLNSCSNKTFVSSLPILDSWITSYLSKLFPNGYSCLVFSSKGFAKTSGNICISDGRRFYRFVFQQGRGLITVESGDGGC